jgi:hypothetical protein
MIVPGDHGPVNLSGYTKPVRSGDRVGNRSGTQAPRESDPNQPPGAVNPGREDIHNPEALREAAGRLIEGGEIDLSSDGAVRGARVDQARRHREAGVYNRRDVIAGVVDRLLEKWQI